MKLELKVPLACKFLKIDSALKSADFSIYVFCILKNVPNVSKIETFLC